MALCWLVGKADAWAERVDRLVTDPEGLVGAAIHSVRAADPASCATVAAWADGLERPLHAHVSEQPAENEACLAALPEKDREVVLLEADELTSGSTWHAAAGFHALNADPNGFLPEDLPCSTEYNLHIVGHQRT